jgi:hypothetical protein
LPDLPEDLVPVEDDAGPLGLGADELVEIITDREDPGEPEEVMARGRGDSAQSVEEIPDLPVATEPVDVPEMEGKISPVPQPDPVEFKVEAVPIDREPVDGRIEPVAEPGEEPSIDPRTAELDAESETDRDMAGDDSAASATLADLSESATPAEPEQLEVSPVGLGADELVEMVAGRGGETVEEETGDRDESESAQEPVLEIPDPPVPDHPVEVAEIETKITPITEPEGIEYKLLQSGPETEAVTFRVEVSEPDTLEVDEEAAAELTRFVEESEEEPIWAVEEEEQDDEEEAAQP